MSFSSNTVLPAISRTVLALACFLIAFLALTSASSTSAYAAETTGGLKAQPINLAKTTSANAAPARPTITSCVSRKGGSLTTKVASVKGAKKYQFAIAADKRFKISRQIKNSNSNMYTYNLLNTGAKYYVKVRAGKIVNGKYVWGPWSKPKTATTRVLKMGFVSLHSSPGGSGVRWWKNCGFKIVGITSPKDPDLKTVDGVLVPGGKDVNPKYYGEKKHRRTVIENAKLDALKLNVCKKCANLKKPLLGICGGEQSLNVALGGSLLQHIPTGYHSGWRAVKIAKGSWLYGMFGSKTKVHHSHHQCVKRLGKGLKATQWDAKDGYIEAIEHVSLPLYGVQWHPENMGTKGRRVAQSFARICMRNAASKA